MRSSSSWTFLTFVFWQRPSWMVLVFHFFFRLIVWLIVILTGVRKLSVLLIVIQKPTIVHLTTRVKAVKKLKRIIRLLLHQSYQRSNIQSWCWIFWNSVTVWFELDSAEFAHLVSGKFVVYVFFNQTFEVGNGHDNLMLSYVPGI